MTTHTLYWHQGYAFHLIVGKNLWSVLVRWRKLGECPYPCSCNPVHLLPCMTGFGDRCTTLGEKINMPESRFLAGQKPTHIDMRRRLVWRDRLRQTEAVKEDKKKPIILEARCEQSKLCAQANYAHRKQQQIRFGFGHNNVACRVRLIELNLPFLYPVILTSIRMVLLRRDI